MLMPTAKSEPSATVAAAVTHAGAVTAAAVTKAAAPAAPTIVAPLAWSVAPHRGSLEANPRDDTFFWIDPEITFCMAEGSACE